MQRCVCPVNWRRCCERPVRVRRASSSFHPTEVRLTTFAGAVRKPAPTPTAACSRQSLAWLKIRRRALRADRWVRTSSVIRWSRANRPARCSACRASRWAVRATCTFRLASTATRSRAFGLEENLSWLAKACYTFNDSEGDAMTRSLIGTLTLALTVPSLALAQGGGPDLAKLKNPAALTEKAPEIYKARFETTKGPIVITVHRAWAPLGAD